MGRRRALRSGLVALACQALVLTATSFTAACASSQSTEPKPAGFYGPLPLAEPFWSAPERTVGILLVDAPPGAVYRIDDGGNVFEVDGPDPFDAPLTRFLDSSAADFEWVAADMTKILEERGFSTARLRASGVDRSVLLAEPTQQGVALAFHEIAVAGGDAAIVLAITPVSWGFLRQYSGGMPAGRRQAFFQIEARLVDVENRAVLWEGFGSDEVILPLAWSVRRGGHEVPDEPVLERALKEALGNAGTSLARSLAEWDGAEAARVWVGPSE